MGFSDEEFDERMRIEGMLALENGDKFHNWLHCEYADRCEGMAMRVGASPLIDLKVCYRNPGRKKCEYWIAFEELSYGLRDAG